ncbi:MAG: hypothetical protein KF816_01395 [Melioribacteraceae bacterium]|jgi:hypothetical protein|nr:hypothetical protein [Melioribacteraceae bacterium]
MIEIKISIDTALALILNRLELELTMRQRDNLLPKSYKLENLTSFELNELIDTALFDTIFMLPVELLTGESNLIAIISETLKALSRNLSREDLLLYPNSRINKILNRVKSIMISNLDSKGFANN